MKYIVYFLFLVIFSFCQSAYSAGFIRTVLPWIFSSSPVSTENTPLSVPTANSDSVVAKKEEARDEFTVAVYLTDKYYWSKSLETYQLRETRFNIELLVKNPVTNKVTKIDSEATIQPVAGFVRYVSISEKFTPPEVKRSSLLQREKKKPTHVMVFDRPDGRDRFDAYLDPKGEKLAVFFPSDRRINLWRALLIQANMNIPLFMDIANNSSNVTMNFSDYNCQQSEQLVCSFNYSATAGLEQVMEELEKHNYNTLFLKIDQKLGNQKDI